MSVRQTLKLVLLATVAVACCLGQNSSLIIQRLSFRSANSNFTSDLLDPQSAAFRARATLLQNELSPVFRNAFSSAFVRINFIDFRMGSVVNGALMEFDAVTIPTRTEIAQALIDAAPNVNGFDIDTSSNILVNGEVAAGPGSGGMVHSLSLTAASLALLAWKLLSQQ